MNILFGDNYGLPTAIHNIPVAAPSFIYMYCRSAVLCTAVYISIYIILTIQKFNMRRINVKKEGHIF